MKKGNAVLAAACCLSVNDLNGAVVKLLRGNEILFAFILITLFKQLDHYKELVFIKLAEKIGKTNQLSLIKSLYKY